ncbi:TPA: hypothetical protein LVL24_002258 [Klebsiella oxytoca]|uniref:hypothetical protein n=1 Tax=Klebsiella oxytoca TaxID=571 RepID=UPI00292D089E|nr:hypothetical protein [Klebsiella oxytoca]HBM2940158.1 hypothetical protein [Klebsiella oxytoca]HBM3035268.1 hypothetical protein [Klebsiella oxytoca]HCQ8325379.1 hypothetical protein [Klebsiella oxytoca]HCZ8658863.1 hypothetical protein [Klebsiella oxytoca]
MEKCPVCNSELKAQPKEYNKNPHGEFLVAKLYECPKDGLFALRLGAEEILKSNELAKIKAKQYLNPSDGKLRVLGIWCEDDGLPHVTCMNYDV